MDASVFVVMYWYRKRRNKIRIVRRYWEHPIVRDRFKLGTFRTLMGQLRSDDRKFFNYLRMSPSTFDDLLNRLKIDLTQEDTNMRSCISAEEKLVICLRYLASGCSYKDLHYTYRVGVSTISNIVRQVTRRIWINLATEFMTCPDTPDKWEQIANGFWIKSNFPHCLGAVDGKHIRVRKPDNSGSMYFNYKEYFSIVLLAVVDSEYRFIYVNVGSYGKDCDSSIWKASTLWKKLIRGDLNIPTPRPLDEQSENAPFVFIGDEGFGLHDNLLRPFGGTHLDRKKRIFNYRLSRARRYVECAFAILANKWRIFHRPLDVKKETAIWIVKACTVLHNFVREKDGFNFENAHLPEIHLNNLPRAQNIRGGLSANVIRTTFADYFLTEAGSVSWQDEAIA